MSLRTNADWYWWKLKHFWVTEYYMPETNLVNLCLVALCGKHARCCSWNKLLPTAKSQKFHLHTLRCRARDLVLVECHSALLQTAFKPDTGAAAAQPQPRHLQHCNDLFTFIKSLHHKNPAWSHKAGLSPTLSGCCWCAKTMDFKPNLRVLKLNY